ncbi:hypothetical protein KIN20_037228 [Parelaphostrongylus tenuis]|uniref:Uncharacterized protein n=1 Tax=Parelaphostrongylus tenuis TaxID=148309 RepID=A0AAD5WL09_PARTN|nr:hypothetical protein KIN20_037228 [Parelaphostrongylus tenuis]
MTDYKSRKLRLPVTTTSGPNTMLWRASFAHARWFADRDHRTLQVKRIPMSGEGTNEALLMALPKLSLP